MRAGRRDEKVRMGAQMMRSGLLVTYASVRVAVVAQSVVLTGILHTWFSYQKLKGLLLRVQSEQAKSAASQISEFVEEIEGQLAWVTHLAVSAKAEDERQFDAARLFRQAPAVTEIAQF